MPEVCVSDEELYRRDFRRYRGEDGCSRDLPRQTDGGAEARRPNVIWVFGDQHRGQALGCNGDPNLDTPNIDALATFGVNWTAAVSGYPLCCPFRGSLLTGTYPHKCVQGHGYRMSTDQPTIAHVLREHGYRTAYFGKWHVDGCRRNPMMHIVPSERRGGFETWVGYENNNSQWNTWVHGGEGRDAFQYRLPGYETDELTDLLIDYIRENAQNAARGSREPFFAVLSVQPPHSPNVAPPQFMARHNPARIQFRSNVPDVPRIIERAGQRLAGYYAQIENLDWNLGRVREALDETGQSLNTHIVFFSDHGDMQGSHGLFGKVLPYEESIRIPFIIGGEIPRTLGRKTGRVDVPINYVDIAPTTLGLCGIDAPEWMEGTDYSHYRLDSRPTRDEPDSAFLQVPIPREHVDKPWRAVVTRDGWKYVSFERIPWLMFNLNEDPFEQVNLVHNRQFAAKREQLNDRLSQWILDTGDTFELPHF